jgi:periplasmic divalent cation tolerance protein
MSDTISQVTITAPSSGWLTQFTHDLLRDHLCASVHIDEIRTSYWWDDQINNRQEFRAIMHTRTMLVSRIVEATNAAHPYQVPCVVATTIVAGNPAYLAWIVSETRQDEETS